MPAESSFPLPRHHLTAALARRASSDAAFAALLRRDPKAALGAHLGIELPDWLEVDLVEERPDRMVIVLPVDLSAFHRPTIDAMVGRPPPRIPAAPIPPPPPAMDTD